MGLNLAVILTESARRHPDRVALKLGTDSLTYRQLEDRAARFAAALRDRGIAPGERVAVMLPNSLQFPIAYYGALMAGAVVVPMNPLLKEREVSYYLENSGARALVFSEEFAESATRGSAAAGVEDTITSRVLDELVEASERIEDVVQREPTDLAVILYTSGTTGNPKGACLAHSNLLWNAHITATTLTLFTPEDAVLCALPLFHTYAQTVVLNAAIHSASQLIVMPRFDAEVALDLLERERVTVFEGVPTMFIALVSAGPGGRDLSRLRMSVSAAASIPVETLLQFERAFDCQVLEGYGLSEASPVVSFNHPNRPRKPGSIGTPIWGVEMKLLGEDGAEVAGDEVGEVAVRGHNVMAGYLGLPEATAEAVTADGWLHTGDLARRDADGYYYIVDRKKDLIIRGGYNVYPREVEEVLYEHAAVLEAAVIGVPHPELGEEVAAAVVLKPGADIDPDEVRRFVKERLAAYKYPRVVAILDELPKGATGKVLKKAIDRERLLERARSVALTG